MKQFFDLNVISEDQNLVAYANGVIYDKNSGLEWVAGPDKDTKWDEAKKWVENLNIAGGGWRMPTLKELEMLYQQRLGLSKLTPLLKKPGRRIWSGETKGSSDAWALIFKDGTRFFNNRRYFKNRRAFAVRLRR